MNAARIQGSHAAIKTGMLAAKAIAEALSAGRSHDELAAYPAACEQSWLHAEMLQTRNLRQRCTSPADAQCLDLGCAARRKPQP